MKIFITTLGSHPWSEGTAEEFRTYARRDRIGVHGLAEHAAEADAILMVDLHQHPADWRLGILDRHPLVRDFASKVFVYDERDLPWCAWPGVYVCMPRSSFDSGRQRAACYIHLVNEQMISPTQPTDLLYSFQGERSHPVRSRVFALRHPRSLIEDSRFNFFERPSTLGVEEYEREVERRKEHYRQTVARSKFVLCPRGRGTSSFRLYEALGAGRVPVIISDEWVAPRGPEWDRCSVRVREAEIDQVPQILERRESEFASLSDAAREVYRDWFAPDVRFHRIAEGCADLLRNGRRGRHPLYFLRSSYLKRVSMQCRSHARAVLNAVGGRRGSV